jgi:hypothetical protein
VTETRNKKLREDAIPQLLGQYERQKPPDVTRPDEQGQQDRRRSATVSQPVDPDLVVSVLLFQKTMSPDRIRREHVIRSLIAVTETSPQRRVSLGCTLQRMLGKNPPR